MMQDRSPALSVDFLAFYEGENDLAHTEARYDFCLSG